MPVRRVVEYVVGSRRFAARGRALEARRSSASLAKVAAASSANVEALEAALSAQPSARLGESEARGAVRLYVAACLRGERRGDMTYAHLIGDEGYAPAEGEPSREELASSVSKAAKALARRARAEARRAGVDCGALASALASALVK